MGVFFSKFSFYSTEVIGRVVAMVTIFDTKMSFIVKKLSPLADYPPYSPTACGLHSNLHFRPSPPLTFLPPTGDRGAIPRAGGARRAGLVRPRKPARTVSTAYNNIELINSQLIKSDGTTSGSSCTRRRRGPPGCTWRRRSPPRGWRPTPAASSGGRRTRRQTPLEKIPPGRLRT